MPTNTYDLIVMGDDFSGLVAATLCARRGMRVLVARTREDGDSYQLGPHTLPVRALPFIGLDSPAARHVIEELHFDHLLKRKLTRHDPPFQLVAPDARIDIRADDVQVARELDRELDAPEIAKTAMSASTPIAAQLDSVLGPDVTFPPAGFWEKREVGRGGANIEYEADAWFEALSNSPLCRALIELPAVLGTRSNPFTLTPVGRARSFHLWRQGTPRMPGNMRALGDVFIEKLQSHSGEVRRVRIAELTWSWGRASGIKLESGETLGAGHIIAAMPLSDLLPLVESKNPKRIIQLNDAIGAAGFRYTLNLLVAEAGIPEGMASTVLVVGDAEAPLIGDNALAINLGAPDAEARVVVTIEAVCPAPSGGQSMQDAFADLRVAIRERLETVMPFLSEHILLAHSPHEGIPAEGVEGALELAEPLAPLPVWNSTIDSYFGVSGVPYQVGIKHLTIGSSQVLHGLGLEGDFATGWCAAKIASAAAGKKRDAPKDTLLAAKR